MKAWLRIIVPSVIFLPKIFSSSFRYLPLHGSESPSLSEENNHSQHHISTVKIETVPHHALVVYGGYYCSGSLIRSQIILTAASCFLKRDKEKILVKLGANTMTEPGQVLPVLELKTHEYFDPTINWNNDIALLVLEEHVQFSIYTKKILIVEPETIYHSGMTLEVASWAYSRILIQYRNNLIVTKMEVLSEDKCKEAYSNNLMSIANFCAKYHPDRHLSDNGGGAVNEDRLVGVVSFGATNEKEPYVAVFTNISYYHRWITLNSQKILAKYCHPSDEVLDDIVYTEYYTENSEGSDENLYASVPI